MIARHFIKLLPLIFVLILSSCLKNKSNEKNTLNFPLTGEILTLDPANAYDSISMTVIYQSYEQLYEYHYLVRPYKVIPLLAEGMPKIDNGETRYTIKIKKNIRYHDHEAFGGKPRFVKAQDFVNQLKRLAFKPLRSNGWWLFDGRVVGLNEFRDTVGSDYEKMKSTPIKGITAINDHTLQIQLKKPYPQMINALTMSFVSPVPIEVLDFYKNELNQHLIGTGPYVLDKWVRASKVTMKRFENYHSAFYPAQGDRLAHGRKLLEDAGKKLPFIDQVVFHIIKESQTRWLQFRSNNLKFLRIPKDNYNSLVTPVGELAKEYKDQGISLQVFSTLTYWWISFNMKDPFLGKNINLRKAIAHAIDVDNYIRTFTNNVGLRANSIYPPGIPGYDPTKKLPYTYNLEKAKEYLAKAGFPNGEGLPEFVFDTRGSSTNHRQKGEFFKTQLSRIGINVKIELNTFPGFLKKAKEGKLQLWLDGWTLDYPDSENILQLLTTQNHPPGPNATYYSNKKFDKYFEQLKVLQNGKSKFSLMDKMEEVVVDDYPWVLLNYARDYFIYHDDLKNFRYSDLLPIKVKYLKLQ